MLSSLDLCGRRALMGCFLVLIFGLGPGVFGQTKKADNRAINTTRLYALEIAKKSFPEIKPGKLHIKTFKSKSSFFKARFSIGRFISFRKMRYLLYVNPKAFEKKLSEDGVRAIIAHELAHIAYYTRKNRVQLIGLSCLLSEKFTLKFERRADLEAIARGFGKGLIEYRKWLYTNIPRNQIAAKKRDYFSPGEIQVMLEVLAVKPSVINSWRKNVPRNINEIRAYEKPSKK